MKEATALIVLIFMGLIVYIVLMFSYIHNRDEANRQKDKESHEKQVQRQKELQDVYERYGLSDNCVIIPWVTYTYEPYRIENTKKYNFDYTNRQFWYTDDSNAHWEIHDFSTIIGCETRLDGQVSHSTTRGGLGSAVIGGVIAGGAGALIGAVVGKKETETTTENTSCQLLVYFKSEQSPLLRLYFNNDSNNKGRFICDQLYARLNSIINS